MRKPLLRLSLIVVVLVTGLHSCADREPTPARIGTLETISPEDAGFSPDRIEELERHLDTCGSAAFLALRDGKVFYSWGNIFEKYPIHSIRKSFMNALYGIYVQRGVIDTNKTLADLGIDDVDPTLTDDEKEARVADLLRSRSGVYHPAAAEATAMIEGRPERGSHEPGEFFYYNNWDFNALGTIFEQETGTKIFDALNDEIAIPLGMRDYTPDDGFYWNNEDNSLHPAYHIRMNAHDMALFGLLYQRDGDWQGRQIVSKEWVRESTRKHSTAMPELGVGYGMLWYTLPDDPVAGRCFFHTGAGVHMLAVYAGLDLVVVHRVDTEAGYDFTLENLIEVLDKFFAAYEDA